MEVSTSSPNSTVDEFNCYPLPPVNYCMSREEFIEVLKNYTFPTPTEWVFVVLHIIVFLVGIVGNFLVCFVVWRSRHMQTVTNLFIVNLAFADFLVLLTCDAPTVLQNITETWFLGESLCKIVIFAQILTVGVSVLTLCAIAVERYYAICRPLSSNITFLKVSITITIIWFVASMVALPNLIFMEIRQTYSDIDDYLVYCVMSWPSETDVAYQLFMAIALYVVPLILMAIVYSVVSFTLWSAKAPGAENLVKRGVSTEMSGPKGKGRNSSKNNITSAEAQLVSRRKVAKMLIAIVCLFFICYLPVHLMLVARYTRILGPGGENMPFLSVVFLLSHWLCYFNSAINPVIYNFMSVKFREEFRCVFSCTSPAKSGRLFPSGTWSSGTSNGKHCSERLMGKSTYRSNTSRLNTPADV